METKNGTTGVRTVKLPWNNYYVMSIQDIPSNCKYSNIDYIGQLMTGSVTEQQRVDAFKDVLKLCRIIVSVNTTSPEVAKFLEKHFDLYSCAKVPVGYNNGFQWHIIIKNKYSKVGNNHYLRDVPVEKKVSKKAIESAITKVLKSKRRKTDVVKDIMENINV